jgi:hypothetical protein
VGTWGTGLYQSDVTVDVRDIYRDCKKLGFAGGDLASVVMETVGFQPVEDEDGALGYLALSDLLWRDGMLPREVKERALRLIRDSKLPLRFEDSASRKKQQAMLDALAAKLGSPQPKAPANRKPPYIEQCDFEIGEVLAYPAPDGAWSLLRVIAYFTRFRGRSPICEVLAWNVTTVPPAARIKRLSFKRRKGIPIVGELRQTETLAELIEQKRLPPGSTWQDYVDQYVSPHIPVIRVSERDPHFHKVQRTGTQAPSQRPFHGDWWVPRNGWTTWKDLPAQLETHFSDEWNVQYD